MTDKARELLERAIEALQENEVEPHSALQEEILAYLTQPRPEFVRLSEEEVDSLTYAPYEPYELICAVENRLVEKNHG